MTYTVGNAFLNSAISAGGRGESANLLCVISLLLTFFLFSPFFFDQILNTVQETSHEMLSSEALLPLFGLIEFRCLDRVKELNSSTAETFSDMNSFSLILLNDE